MRRFREVVEQARLAREAGFDALAAGHHYLSPPFQSLQSLPLLARLSGEAPGMELCLSVLLLAMLNPVQTAEEVASLDIMSEGSVVFGIGIGYRDVEYEAFGMTSRERVPRMLEALDLIKRLWTEEVVTHRGPLLPRARRDLHDPPGAKALPADLDRRQCRPGGLAHRAPGSVVVHQPARRTADDRAAMAAL